MNGQDVIMIGTDEPGFDIVFERWHYKMHEVLSRDNPYSTNYAETHYTEVRINDYEKPELEIPTAIRKAIAKCKKSGGKIENVILAYDTQYCDIHRLEKIMTAVWYRRRNRNYQMACTSSLRLTTLVKPELLNNLLPRLNFVAISYLHD